MIKAILWDIDGTLLNFKEAEKCAIRKCFSVFKLGECTDEMIARYSTINDKYWKSLERGEITKQEVLHNRFEEFFQRENIMFHDIEAFNQHYQIYLGDTVFFNDNCLEMVKEFQGQIKQYAVTNGTYIAQERKLKRSGLDKVFDDVFISEQIGIDKPNKAFFDAVWEKVGRYQSDEVIIIGDSLTSDMQGGVNAGILCCWYNPNRDVNNSGLEIQYEIQNLQQVKEIIVANF